MKLLALFIAGLVMLSALPAADDGWISMFDGKTLEGSKANERPESWSVKDRMIVGDGEASYLFWRAHECENYEFKADVKIAMKAIRACNFVPHLASVSRRVTRFRSTAPIKIRSKRAISTTL